MMFLDKRTSLKPSSVQAQGKLISLLDFGWKMAPLCIPVIFTPHAPQHPSPAFFREHKLNQAPPVVQVFSNVVKLCVSISVALQGAAKGHPVILAVTKWANMNADIASKDVPGLVAAFKDTFKKYTPCLSPSLPACLSRSFLP
jgi:hypothetical protein